MSEEKQNKVVFTPGEFAALFGKSQTWGYRQLYSGKVKAITEYGRTLIPASEVERILGEAGRYLGAGATVETSAEKQKKPPIRRESKIPRRMNPWKDAVGKRRVKPAAQSKKRIQTRAGLNALRNSALRKLNRQSRG